MPHRMSGSQDPGGAPTEDQIKERAAEIRRKRDKRVVGGRKATVTDRRREAIRKHIAEFGPTSTHGLAAALSLPVQTIRNATDFAEFELRFGLWHT